MTTKIFVTHRITGEWFAELVHINGSLLSTSSDRTAPELAIACLCSRIRSTLGVTVNKVDEAIYVDGNPCEIFHGNLGLPHKPRLAIPAT